MKEELKNFSKHEEITTLIYAKDSTLLTELPFKRFIGSFENDEIKQLVPSNIQKNMDLFVRGVMDLVIHFEDGIYIIDYKTNVKTEEESTEEFHEHLKKVYIKQLLAYHEMARFIFGQVVRGVFLYSTTTNSLIPFDMNEIKTIINKN